jgi:hypothetical protein
MSTHMCYMYVVYYVDVDVGTHIFMYIPVLYVFMSVYI